MKKMTNLSLRKVTLGFILLLVGCVVPALPQPSSTLIQVSATSTWEVFSATPSLLSEPTETATLLPTKTPTQTAFPTRTASPTITLTWTPRPTLPIDQAQALVQELIETNGGCKLPCWWGIVPGRTTWVEANAFLRTFATTIMPFSMPTSQYEFYEIRFENLPENVLYDSLMSVITVDKGTVQRIAVAVYYPLPEFLSTYGQPNEVWVYVRGFTIMGENAFFVIALFYPEQGILAVYKGLAEPQKIVQICPGKPSTGHRWYLWNPELKLTFMGVGSKVSLDVNEYRSLEEAAGMDVKIFYNTFKDPANAQQCFGVEDPNYP